MSRPVAAIVPAAGAGERLRAGVPKAIAARAGEPILCHAVRGLAKDDVMLVLWDGTYERLPKVGDGQRLAD